MPRGSESVTGILFGVLMIDVQGFFLVGSFQAPTCLLGPR
jgi:hypothetical protein